MRAFIAIDIGMKGKMGEVYEKLRKTGAKLKMVEPQNIHLTLKFLGEINGEMVGKIKGYMEEVVADIQPFVAKLQGTGVFPGRSNIRVIWIGFADDGQTEKMARHIDEKLSILGFKRDKSYKPHVTIARMKSGEKRDKVLEIIDEYKDVIFGEIECREIKLKKSTLTPKGPIYEDIEVVKL